MAFVGRLKWLRSNLLVGEAPWALYVDILQVHFRAPILGKEFTASFHREGSINENSGRIKRAPNCGHHVVSPSPPSSRRGVTFAPPLRKGIGSFPVLETPPFLWAFLLVLDLKYHTTLPPPDNEESPRQTKPKKGPNESS